MWPNYSLSQILPFVRQSLRGRGSFSFDQYVDALLAVLDAAGIEKFDKNPPYNAPPIYNFSQLSPFACEVISEAFFYLQNLGMIIPMPNSREAAFRDSSPYRLTSRGREWVIHAEPPPEDYNGYLELLTVLAPNAEPVVTQYVSEGLKSFSNGTYFAAAVMLGAASEAEIYFLADSISIALRDQKFQADLKRLTQERKLNSLFNFVEKVIAGGIKAKTIPYAITDGSERHLLSLFESIRIQRNNAVHPMSAQVSSDSVRHSFNAFPHALETAENLRTWFAAHPETV